MIYSTKSMQPPLLCLLLGYPLPPPGANVLYVWPQRGEGEEMIVVTETVTQASRAAMETIVCEG